MHFFFCFREAVHVPGGYGPCNRSRRTQLLCSSDIYGARELLSQKQHDCGCPHLEWGTHSWCFATGFLMKAQGMQRVLGVLPEAALTILSLSKLAGNLGRRTLTVCAGGWPAAWRESPEASAAKRITLSGQVSISRTIFLHIYLILSVGYSN